MANPFGITEVNVPGLLAQYDQQKRQRLADQLTMRKVQQEDDALRRQQQVQAAIGSGAKPEQVMALDVDQGAKYADALSKMDDRQFAQTKRQAGALVSIGQQLGRIPAGPARSEALRQAVPVLKQVGITDEMLNGFDVNNDAQLNNVIASHRALLGTAEKLSTATPGSVVYDEQGNIRLQVPFAPKTQTLGEGQTLVEIPGSNPMGYDPYRQIIGAESSGRQFGSDGQPLTSAKGAIGIGQVMPSTGPEAARLAGLPWDEDRFRNDPAYNEAIGRAYHAKQLADFGGDEAAAAAAYNAGPARVRSAMQGGSLDLSRLPAETRAYVQKVAPGAFGGARVIAQGAPKQSPAPSGYRWKDDGTLEPIPGGPATRATIQNKAVPDSTAKRMETDVSTYQALDRAINNFKPDFAGNILGGLENTAQGMFNVGTPGQRDWWADFNATDNMIRNSLFGSALTEQEKKAYESTTISPRMEPSQIIQNLTRRRGIVESALKRRANYLKKSGYNPEAVDALMEGDAFEASPSSAQAMPTRTATNPKTGERMGLINGQWVKM